MLGFNKFLLEEDAVGVVELILILVDNTTYTFLIYNVYIVKYFIYCITYFIHVSVMKRIQYVYYKRIISH